MDRLWKGLRRTREQVGQQWLRLVGLKVSGQFWEELEASLYQADLGPSTVERLLDHLRRRLQEDRPVDLKQLRALLAEEMLDMLPPDEPDPWAVTGPMPFTILLVGVNGTGKTTTAAKLAAGYTQQGRRVLLGAADTFRAAATEQLMTWAERIHVDVVRQEPGADPAAVAFDTLAAAKSRAIDVAIIDTAGRLHTKAPLMQELGKIRRVVERALPGAPQQTLLVLDATTGQNGIQQARIFSEAASPSGIVLTKLDGTAKGGMVFQIQEQLQIPVRWVGVGETVDDLIPFVRQDFVQAIIGE